MLSKGDKVYDPRYPDRHDGLVSSTEVRNGILHVWVAWLVTMNIHNRWTEVTRDMVEYVGDEIDELKLLN